MAFKLGRVRRKPAWMRTRDNPSKAIDVIDIRYTSIVNYQYQHHRAEDILDVEVRSFDVYRNGVWVGQFDNSPRGLIEYAEALR